MLLCLANILLMYISQKPTLTSGLYGYQPLYQKPYDEFSGPHFIISFQKRPPISNESDLINHSTLYSHSEIAHQDLWKNFFPAAASNKCKLHASLVLNMCSMHVVELDGS